MNINTYAQSKQSFAHISLLFTKVSNLRRFNYTPTATTSRHIESLASQWILTPNDNYHKNNLCNEIYNTVTF